MSFSANTERALATLLRVAAIWRERLDGDWTPPDGSAFPWAQVRLSLGALLPGMRAARGWVTRTSSEAPPAPNAGGDGEDESESSHSTGEGASLASSPAPPALGAGGAPNVTLILAGNTPLLAWSPLCACLLAGVETVRVKLSRDETVWTHLFVESLREADPVLAERIELYDFPGEDERTYALLQNADAVIAYGSDAAIGALQFRTPPGIPFFDYGHAVSIGLYLLGGNRELDIRAYAGMAARAFAQDVLMYDQQGCLSPHTLYVSPLDKRDTTGRSAAGLLAYRLASRFADVSGSLDTAPPTGPVAARVRTARDVALFNGAAVRGDNGLHWTVIESPEPLTHPEPVGHGVITVSPVASPDQLRELLQPVWGIVSCAGVAGDLPPEWVAVLRDAGVSRLCKPGEMQTPPLDWENGNRDLLAELWKISNPHQ